MRFKTLFFFILIVLLFGGCTAGKSKFYAPEDLGPNHVQNMAHDLAPVIAENFPSLKTQFVINSDSFGNALAHELGQKGYSIKQYKKNTQALTKEALLITYTIDWLNTDQAYIALNIGNKQRITKKYSIEEAGTFPGEQTLIGLAQ